MRRPFARTLAIATLSALFCEAAAAAIFKCEVDGNHDGRPCERQWCGH